jgi:hypothetical protein
MRARFFVILRTRAYEHTNPPSIGPSGIEQLFHSDKPQHRSVVLAGSIDGS